MTYTLQELKGKIRVGDEVRESGLEYYSKVVFSSNEGFITDSGDSYGYFTECIKGENDKKFELKPCPITWDNIKVGDFIEDKEGRSRILAVQGSLIFVSVKNIFHLSGFFGTREELDDLGFKIVQPPHEVKSIREVTMQEVCEKFGEEVKIKKEL